MVANLPALTPDTSVTPGSAPEPVEPAPSPRRRRRLLLLALGGAAFVLGLATVCLAVAAWTFVSPQTGSQSLDAAISLAADRYWNTFNVNQAKRDLAGIDRGQLAQAIDKLQQQTADPQKRTRLQMLAAALDLPIPERPIWTTLLRDPVIGLGLLFPLVPMLAAALLFAVPLARNFLVALPRHIEAQQESKPDKPTEEGEPQDESKLGEALTDMPAPEVTPAEAGPEEEASIPQDAQASTEGKKEGAEDEEEELDEEEETDQDNKPEAVLEDLASVFEYEDTSLSTLENFCKELPDMNISQVVAASKQVAHDLHASNLARMDLVKPGALAVGAPA